MGLLDKLLGRVAGPEARNMATETSARYSPLPEDHFIAVVGESHYQDALHALARQCVPGADGRLVFQARLIPEPNNRFDGNAISVHGATGHVGYLSREDALRFARTFEALRDAGFEGGTCTVILSGGDRDRPSFGVVLTLAYPETCEMQLGISGGLNRDGHHRSNSTKTKSGELRGKHYTDYTEEVKTLRRHGHDDSAEKLLLELVDVVEAEAAEKNWGVAPWYYEQLAIIYRKRRDATAEVATLERYAAAPHAPGVGPGKLVERLEKARQLAEREATA